MYYGKGTGVIPLNTFPRAGIKTRVGDYILPAVGVIPALLLAGGNVNLPVEPRHALYRDVYRRDLLEEVSSQLAEISQLLKSLQDLREPDITDLVFVEAPDHPPYSEAYVWERIEMPTRAAPPRNEPPDELPAIWQY